MMWSRQPSNASRSLSCDSNRSNHLAVGSAAANCRCGVLGFGFFPGGLPAAGFADGGAGVAVMPISEILTAKGVDYAGSLSPDIQFPQVFSAAVAAGSGEVDNAKRLIAFFASPRAAEAIKKSGMEAVASAR